MKKVLFTSHTANFCKFNRPYMRWFKEQGWQVDYACACEEEVYDYDNLFKISFARVPWANDNIRAYKDLKKLLDENHYDIIHTHTPMGSVITRLAARNARKKGTKVIYTAHGLHFYKGAPLINWLLYYPMEKWMSRYTDCLVLINEEDYQNCIRRHFKARRIERIDGVGVDLNRFECLQPEQKKQFRKELGISENDFILVCVAEFIPRKNHSFILDNMKQIHEKIPNAKLVLLGQGELMPEYKADTKRKGMQEYVSFLGYRSDVNKICAISDVLVSASFQEGLPMNMIEAMAVGIPVVCSDIRGQRDLIKDGENGYLFQLGDSERYCNRLVELYNNPELREKIKENNLKDVKKYSLDNAIGAMEKIYRRYMVSGK